MYIVLNICKLVGFIFLGGLFFFGQGWIIVSLLSRPFPSNKEKNRFVELIPLALLSGYIVNYAVILAVQSLTTSLIISGMLTAIGLGLCLWQVAHRRLECKFRPSSWVYLAGVGIISLFIISPIVAEPLLGWDARWIWFFHAKMIYTANSIGQSAGWQNAAVGFSHVDYPNLVPVIAAQTMRVVGFWNEYLPKLSIFYMFLPAMFWLLSFARKSFSYAILLAALMLSFDPWLWNGYMDGILALYLSISVLLLGRYIVGGNKLDAISSVCCLFALPYIKNEGIPAALVGGAAVLLAVWLKHKPHISLQGIRNHWGYWLSGVIGVLPLVLWSIYKNHWGIRNSLGIGSSESIARIFQRFTDGSTKLIFSMTFQNIESSLFLVSILLLVIICWKISVGKHILPAAWVALVYCLGMAAVYYLTPFDVLWHLSTSIDRTVLPVNGCLYVVGYFLLEAIEKSLSRNKATDTLPSVES